jgi:hypothetical protein
VLDANRRESKNYLDNEGDFIMHKSSLKFSLLCFSVLLLAVAAVQAAPQNVNFVGTWEMTMSGGGEGGGGGQGGGGGHRGGGGPQTLTISQSGDKYKVSRKTRRGEIASDATVSGNTISWTEERQNREGETMKIQFKATLDGDSMKGTMAGGQFSREFTAKRTTTN